MPRPRQESQNEHGRGRLGPFIVLTHCQRQGRLGPLVAAKAARRPLPPTMAAPPPGGPLAALGECSAPIMSCIVSIAILLVQTLPRQLSVSLLLGKSPLLFYLRGTMVAACGRPVRRAPAAKSPILRAAAQSSSLAVLGNSLYDALSSRRFSGWQLNKNSRSPSSFFLSTPRQKTGSVRWMRRIPC